MFAYNMLFKSRDKNYNKNQMDINKIKGILL